MRSFRKYPYPKFSMLACLLGVLMFQTPAYADDSRLFENIFGEFSDDHQVNDLVSRDAKKKGAKPVSPLSSEILLSKDTVARLDNAIKKLEKIVKSGGWPTLARKGMRIKHGDRNPEVARVKRQLIKLGDLSRTETNLIDEFDLSTEDAIFRFQERHGLRKSGYVDRRTRMAMAIGAKKRLAQLRVNRSRIKKAKAQLKKASRYVVVNVPDYTLQAVNKNRIELTSRVVVGRQDRQTPDIRATIVGVNFSPFWHVPDSLVRADLIPNQLKDPNFMKDNHVRVFEDYNGGRELNPAKINWRSPAARRYKFRQDPGEHNALGLIRINMPNKDIVYLHDTPTKKLYGLRARAYSAGCVRVEKIRDLTAWLLDDAKKWAPSKINSVIESRKRVNARVKKKVPVQFVYVTSWVDARGRTHFRDDIYGRDKGLRKYAGKIEKKKGSFSP